MTSRSTILISALALGLTASGASAQAGQAPAGQALAAQAPTGSTTASFAAGARVSDTAGGEVGTITREDGDFVILKTDKHEVRLPKTSFAAADGGFVIAMTRAQLNAEVDKTLAEASAKLVPGAAVTGTQGASVGTIETIDDEFVTLKLASGKLVRLPRTGIAPGPNGAVIGMTAAELEAAAAGATGS